MKMAIALQCHYNPVQINKIIEFFDKEYFDIYIHVDKKASIIHELLSNSNTYIIEDRVNVKWGQFSQVQATLNLFKEIKKSGNSYKYIHLIGGQDLPLKKTDEFIAFFSQNNTEYLEQTQLPNGWPSGGLDRVNVYYPQCMIERPNKIIYRIIRVIYRDLILHTKVFQRKFNLIPHFYGGSSWFSITGECFQYIMNYLEDNPQYIKFFKNSLCADEVFFHTIIMNSKFSKHVNYNNLRYIDWSDSKMGSPKNLNRNDIDIALNTECFFARKIDDMQVVDYLYKKIG